MKSNIIYSDEMLNAYIDEELGRNDHINISATMALDCNLRARVEELRVVRSLVKISYEKLDLTPTSLPTNKQFGKIMLSVAASLILMVGTLAGWLANQFSSSPSLLDLAQTIENRTSIKTGKNNIMLHLSSNNKHQWKVVLDEIVQTLDSANDKHSDVKVHLVTNGGAINVARLKNNPFAARIQNMMKKYPNFTMQVCRQTLERLYYSKNKKVKLVPGTEIVRSALGEVIKRRQEGWLYLKI